MSACSGKQVTEVTLKTLSSLRDEVSFNMFYDTTVKKARKYNFAQNTSKPRKSKAPKYSIL